MSIEQYAYTLNTDKSFAPCMENDFAINTNSVYPYDMSGIVYYSGILRSALFFYSNANIAAFSLVFLSLLLSLYVYTCVMG